MQAKLEAAQRAKDLAERLAREQAEATAAAKAERAAAELRHAEQIGQSEERKAAEAEAARRQQEVRGTHPLQNRKHFSCRNAPVAFCLNRLTHADSLQNRTEQNSSADLLHRLDLT